MHANSHRYCFLMMNQTNPTYIVSFFFSTKIQNIRDMLDQTPLQQCLPDHLAPEYRSPAFILSLKYKYPTF